MQEYEQNTNENLKKDFVNYLKISLIAIVLTGIFIVALLVWREKLILSLAWQVIGVITVILSIVFLLLYFILKAIVIKNFQKFHERNLIKISYGRIVFTVILCAIIFYFGFKTAIEESIELGDASWPSHYSYAYKGLEEIGYRRYDSAMNYLNLAIEQNPKEAQAYYLMGELYYLQNEYDLAITELTNAIKIDFRFADAYYLRALIYVYESNFELAMSDYLHVVEFTKDHDQREIAMGELNVLMGKVNNGN